MSEQTQTVKPWYQSKTIWGGIVMFVAVLAGLFGIEISESEKSLLTESLVGLGGAVGLVLTILGRKKATKAIGKATN